MSSIKLCFVAVNLGGSCGGVWYCFGAMVEFVSGRNDCDNEGFRNGFGFMYWIIDGVRTPSRREARMTATDMKRPRPMRRSLGRREVATVAAW